MIFGTCIEINRFRKLVLTVNTLTKTRWISCILGFDRFYPFFEKLVLWKTVNASLLCIHFVFLFGYPTCFSRCNLSPGIDFTWGLNGTFGSLVSSFHNSIVMGTIQVSHSRSLEFPSTHLRDQFFQLFSKRRSPIDVLGKWRLS